MRGMPTLVGCLVQVSTLQRTPQRVISTYMALVEELAAQLTKTDPATCVTGELDFNLYIFNFTQMP